MKKCQTQLTATQAAQKKKSEVETEIKKLTATQAAQKNNS